LDKVREFLENMRFTALLLRSTNGEAFANPKRRPQIEFFHDGQHQILFEAEIGPFRSLQGLPERWEVGDTVGWIRQTMAGKLPIPYPIVNQLACCLYACGYTEDMNQAKAIAAVETGSLAAA
jgi:anthranilate phosphoribosyltransferase